MDTEHLKMLDGLFMLLSLSMVMAVAYAPTDLYKLQSLTLTMLDPSLPELYRCQ